MIKVRNKNGISYIIHEDELKKYVIKGFEEVKAKAKPEKEENKKEEVKAKEKEENK